MDKLVLIDGNSLLNRAFYATPLFSTKDGRPTNAIFGFVRLVFKIISDLNPEYFIVTFDMHAPTFRHKMYDGYKATRSPMPQELASQVEPLKSLLNAMNIATCQCEGLEADDLLGTLSKRFNVHSYIYTGDRDSFQLVDEKTDVYYTKRGVTDLLKLSLENFEEQMGYKPAQTIDLKSLMGDKSDNIPGVSGIGETTAKKLIAEYNSLDGVYSHVDEIKSPSLRQKLKEGKESAELSYKLATIERNCNLNVDLNNCKTPHVFSDEVKKMFIDFEFKSLIPLINFSEEEVKDEKVIEYPEKIAVNNIEQFEKICSYVGEYCLCLDEKHASFYVNGKHYEAEFFVEDLLNTFSFEATVTIFAKVFENAQNKVVVYDFKRLLHVLSPFNVSFNCSVDDVAIMCYIADYFSDANSLEELCKEKGLDSAYSAFALNRLCNEYSEVIEQDGISSLYKDIELPLTQVLYDMESCGVTVDVNQLEGFGVKYQAELSELKTKIYELCDCEFNINSPSQLGEVLFEKLGLKAGKKNKSGKYSTSADILEKLAKDNEVVKLVLRFRQIQKLYSTYIEGIKPLIDRKTNLVHTTYTQTVTSTGRLSSVNPNLQNIPVREDEGRELRKLFIPKNGNVFIDADYSQIELRLLAHFSGCKELIEAYNNDEDVHAVTASQVFGVPLNEVTPKMRREAKAVNFGIIYGISEFGLANNIGCDVKTAKAYIETYFKHYSAVKEYMESNVEFAKTHGYVATLTGRKRYIKEINSTNYNLRQFGERASMNMPLQGSSADIIKIAMVNIHNKLKSEGMKTKLILQVHDELILDAPEDEQDKACEILKYEMENAIKLNVPLKVEVHKGKNWYEAK
ncbi:MAG: DNA polymerase I [Candidatus Coproplasma sp.]